MTDASLAGLYDVVALIGAFLAIYVMQKTEHDRINRVDPLFVQWARRASFVLVALSLCYSMLATDWVRSVPVIMMVAAGSGILAVNALALHMRVPPARGRLGLSRFRPAAPPPPMLRASLRRWK